MSKKSKRQTRKSPAVSTVTAATPSSNVGGKTPDSSFNPDYSQTIKDLKRIGILAGTFFAILVALSFLLR